MRKFSIILVLALSLCLFFSCGISNDKSGASNETATDTKTSTETSTNTSTDTENSSTPSNTKTETSTNSDTPLPEITYYEVSFVTNGGDETGNDNILVAEGELLEKPYSTKPGYKLEAWLTEDGEEYDFNLPVLSSFSLYASWAPDKNMIYFSANGGSGELAPIEAMTESKVALPTPEFERYGYFFQGWSLDPNGTFESRIVGEYTVAGEGNTLYAIWAKTVCYIRYHRDNASVINVPFTYDQLPITVEKSPSSELGYCDGWTDSYGNEVTEVAELKEYILYERWVGVHKISNEIYRVDNIFESLTIPQAIFDSEIYSIGEGAFEGCDKLKTLVLPDTIKKIEREAFKDCSALESINLPESITSIESYAFMGCASLKDVTLPSNITALGGYVFKDCASITQIDIPSGITSLGVGSFYNCTSLESISLGKYFDTVPIACFSGCKKLSYINVDQENTNFQSINGNIVSPDGTNLLLVAPAKSTIDDAIPSTIDYIDSYAFSDIEGLYDMVIPDRVTSIGKNAFREAKSIRSLDTGSLYSIPSNAFYEMPRLVTLVINENTHVVGSKAFSSCKNLVSVTLKGSFDSFADDAFESSNRIYEFFNLTGTEAFFGGIYKNVISAARIPDKSKVEVDGDFVFFKLTETIIYLTGYLGEGGAISLPDKPDCDYYWIKHEVFKYCGTITEVTIPDSVTHIEDYAFYACGGIKKVHIGSGVVQLSGASFHICPNITELTISEENESFIIDGNAVYNEDKTELIKFFGNIEQFYRFTVPEGVTKISDSAFSGVKLHYVDMPSTLEHIGNYAFYMTYIGTMTIPSSVVFLGRESLNTDMLYSLTFEEPATWRGEGGWFGPESLSDPFENADAFTKTIVKDHIWRRDE